MAMRTTADSPAASEGCTSVEGDNHRSRAEEGEEATSEGATVLHYGCPWLSCRSRESKASTLI